MPRRLSKTYQPFAILRRCRIQSNRFGGGVVAGELSRCFDLLVGLLTRLKLGEGLESLGCNRPWTQYFYIFQTDRYNS
jgi:hypothetical protein